MGPARHAAHPDRASRRTPIKSAVASLHCRPGVPPYSYRIRLQSKKMSSCSCQSKASHAAPGLQGRVLLFCIPYVQLVRGEAAFRQRAVVPLHQPAVAWQPRFQRHSARCLISVVPAEGLAMGAEQPQESEPATEQAPVLLLFCQRSSAITHVYTTQRVHQLVRLQSQRLDGANGIMAVTWLGAPLTLPCVFVDV